MSSFRARLRGFSGLNCSGTFNRVEALSAALGVCVLLCAALAQSAAADTGTSQNWSGYVAHRHGVAFRHIHASWREPSALCTPGQRSYAAAWVGLGGYSHTAKALEQIGTELDCTPTGAFSYVWYELVPAPSVTVRMEIAPGDLMRASVTVRGHHVTLTVSDVTWHESFVRQFRVRTVDVSSADWIMEAPSQCVSMSCQVLPLADYGTLNFGAARVADASGANGAIAGRAWQTTRVILTPQSAGGSIPAPLSFGGSAFGVSYATATSSRLAARVAAASGPSGSLQPGGVRR